MTNEPSYEETVRLQQIALITGSSESVEWYTPKHIATAAQRTLGMIDLDPASCAEANATVRADRYHSKEDDGMAYPWHGRVWLNPPYGWHAGPPRIPNVALWSNKLIAEYDAGRVTAALLLVKAALGYEWFEQLWRKYPTCVLRKRLSFDAPDRVGGQAKHATAILYLGPKLPRFYQHFGPLGRIFDPAVVDAALDRPFFEA